MTHNNTLKQSEHANTQPTPQFRTKTETAEYRFETYRLFRVIRASRLKARYFWRRSRPYLRSLFWFATVAHRRSLQNGKICCQRLIIRHPCLWCQMLQSSLPERRCFDGLEMLQFTLGLALKDASARVPQPAVSAQIQPQLQTPVNSSVESKRSAVARPVEDIDAEKLFSTFG